MSNVITARVSDEVLAMFDNLASSRERSRAWVVGRLIESAVQSQLEFDEFIQAGLDDVETGRVIPHERIVDTIMQRRARPVAA